MPFDLQERINAAKQLRNKSINKRSPRRSSRSRNSVQTNPIWLALQNMPSNAGIGIEEEQRLYHFNKRTKPFPINLKLKMKRSDINTSTLQRLFMLEGIDIIPEDVDPDKPEDPKPLHSMNPLFKPGPHKLIVPAVSGKLPKKSRKKRKKSRKRSKRSK